MSAKCNMEQHFLNGVASGIATSACVGLLTYFGHLLWLKVVLPRWHDIIYKVEDISGEWDGRAHTPSGLSHQTIEVSRRGHKVFGVIRAVKGKHKGKSYKFEGTYQSLLLTATYCAGDARELDSGSFTLMLADGGKKLVGGEAAHISATNKVGWFEYEWERPHR